MNSLFFCLAMLVHAVEQSSVEQSPAQSTRAEFKKRGDFALAGMQSTLESLVTGVFKSRENTSSSRENERRSVDSDAFCAFDARRSLFRFDRTRYGKLTKYARTPLEAFVYTPETRVACIVPANFDPGIQVRPFDVRSVALATLGDFKEGIDLPTFVRHLSNSELTQADIEDDGQYRLVWVLGVKKEIQRTVFLDPKMDFVPTRLELRERSDESSDIWPAPFAATTTKWEKINNQWVPIETVISSLMREETTKKITFRWEAVNSLVSDDEFGLKGFALPKGTTVGDRRLQVPVVIETVGYAAEPRRTADIRQGGSHNGPMRIVLMGLTAVVCGVLAVLVVRNRYRLLRGNAA